MVNKNDYLNSFSTLMRFFNARRISIEALKHKATQKPRELELLVQAFRRHRFKVVVEIGTDKGGTLYVWKEVADKNSLIISVDKAKFGDEKFVEQLKYPNQNIILLNKDSHLKSTRKTIENLLRHKPIDLLFIDGDHSYKGVKRDWELYSPLVKKGGLVIFHDINRHQIKQCQVEKFWQEIKHNYSHLEICMDIENNIGIGRWGGIGMIYY